MGVSDACLPVVDSHEQQWCPKVPSLPTPPFMVCMGCQWRVLSPRVAPSLVSVGLRVLVVQCFGVGTHSHMCTPACSVAYLFGSLEGLCCWCPASCALPVFVAVLTGTAAFVLHALVLPLANTTDAGVPPKLSVGTYAAAASHAIPLYYFSKYGKGPKGVSFLTPPLPPTLPVGPLSLGFLDPCPRICSSGVRVSFRVCVCVICVTCSECSSSSSSSVCPTVSLVMHLASCALWLVCVCVWRAPTAALFLGGELKPHTHSGLLPCDWLQRRGSTA